MADGCCAAIKGKDDVARGAEVRIFTKGKVETLRRPLQNLVPLELRENSREDDKVGKDKESVKECENEMSSKERKPKHAAARDARWETQLVLDSG